ncbi:MAG: glutamate synthase domain-containing protein 2/glutamate synthase domain-containing protein 1 [Kiritimatiellia bacterium]|jgi:glutamate synthase domain-containing protein 2/glutamate synthase domain-containing protein 1/glutamate synthase domain-containing protein 3
MMEKFKRIERGVPPEAQGLYHPQNEHDACGVGFICNMNGERSNPIIHQALDILCKLTHRGASSSDNKTGDGAGLVIQLPHEFLVKVSSAVGITLPAPGAYGTGLVYLPKLEEQAAWIMEQFELAIAEDGQHFLGWREVPVDSSVLGPIAAKSEPRIMQIFIGKAGDGSQRDFERDLFIIRKTVEQQVNQSEFAEAKEEFYVPTLSSQTLIYKGLLKPEDFAPYFIDLMDPDLKTCLAMVHQRYSTNTFPKWKLAQPFRFLCHNGEINTVRGNANWMNARQYQFASERFGDKIDRIFPVCIPGNSDSATLDNTLELLYHTGRSLPHAMMMMVPEAWQNHQTMADSKKAFYEYHSCLMEPWDGPALMPFTDGSFVGAILDRNGLRPARWTLTKDNLVVCASETGVLDIAPENVARKGRIQPGRMFLINIDEGRIVEDEEIKDTICSSHNYRQWLNENLLDLEELPKPGPSTAPRYDDLVVQQKLFGYTLEDLRIVLRPMAASGAEAIGSMGVDTPLAVLSEKPQLVYNYFKQLFAQVTNPPLDAIREELVTSLITNIGEERDLFQETPEHSRLLKLKQPILTDYDLEHIRQVNLPGLKSATIDIHFELGQGGQGLRDGLARICDEAGKAIADGCTILILSDRGAGKDQMAMPALLATGAVHHHLIQAGLRIKCGLVVETAEAREVHHMATLIGYGAGAINPYLAFATLDQMAEENYFTEEEAINRRKNYIKAVGKGLLKVMSKIGVSTLHSYRGAQIFEAVGLNSDVISHYFVGTASRIEGAGLDQLAADLQARYDYAFPPKQISEVLDLDVGGLYQWRRSGEHHALNPLAIATLQQAARVSSREEFKKFSTMIDDQNTKLCTLRGLFAFAKREPVPLEEVEPWTDIVKRFKTGAMSYGSISREAHETLAIAMNRIGGKSNSGEGGEEEHRYIRDENGDSRSSGIKQVASGRFGVTSYYLANSKEIQIKMAQGAKPGEGGQLPGIKVSKTIAKARNSTPGVTLISPPPHHDIYSIEDLAQLIHDLKNANRDARINVKLVAEVGVGTVAAGVAKGKADVVLISGWDGGTGASPETSLKHCGLPWELGLSEAHQTLLANDLRSRIVVEADGKLMTGRDVAIACLLGAEEFGFSSAPLVVMGCIMMRVCHLNTCPVGIATQDENLRKKFQGTPDEVINYFHLVAEELREIMAELGFRTINEMVGRSDKLEMGDAIDHYKARHIDLSKVLYRPEVPPEYGTYCQEPQDHGLDEALDNELIEECRFYIDHREPIVLEKKIKNTNRTVGTMLSREVSLKYGAEGLNDDTIRITFNGNAGQSFGAFLARGITFRVEGDANDYYGKGLSGGKLIIAPPPGSTFIPEENIIIGNVAFYGATAGESYIRGIAGERFCVRNSGVRTVVEGIGDHGCEYMTGGCVVVLGETGRNFAAGMSGGVAYVYNDDGDFAREHVNADLVDLEDVRGDDVGELKDMIEKHFRYTGSDRAKEILGNWDDFLSKFVKVMPKEYKLALARQAREEEERQHEAQAKAMARQE